MAVRLFFMFFFTALLFSTNIDATTDQSPALLRSLAGSTCIESLKRYGAPDATFTPKFVGKNCPELCRNSSGHFVIGEFAHPWDCKTFISCHRYDEAWIGFCQSGLHFNQNKKQCDWPRNANCTQKPIPSATYPTSPMFVVVALTSAPPSLTDFSDLPRSTCKETDPNFNSWEDLGFRPDLCTAGSGLYPAPDCRFYIRCNGTRAAAAKCPAGFLFDTSKCQCDWPHKIESCSQLCQDNSLPPTKPTPTTPSPHQPTTKAVPAASSAPLIQGSSTTRATTTTTTTQKTTTTLPPRDPLCKNVSGNFEYPNDCTKYVTCQDWHAVLHDCPKGLVFVQAKGWCNWTWMLPEQHRCYKAFDNGSGDCPFYRGENDTAPVSTLASSTAKPLPVIY